MVRMLVISAMAATLFTPSIGETVAACAGLALPVDGAQVRGFAPTGRYSGHWGVDWSVPADTPVRAAGPGTVSFTGVVAANQTVTVDHGGGLRTSYSYLADVLVKRGQRVEGSTTLGTSGVAHGFEGLHFSVRIGGTYVDPLSIIGCRLSNPSKALRLVPLRVVS